MAELVNPPSSPTTRILVVDDHPIVREGLSSVLAREPDLEVCGEAEDVPSAIKLVHETRPNVVTIDISLRNGSGIDLIRRIAKNDPTIRMVVCSLHNERLYAERAMRAGALGYVNKHEATEMIVAAIRRVLHGKVYLSDRISEQLAHRLIGGRGKEVQAALESLSDRELDVFRMIGNGLTSSQIARELHLGVKTVDTYRSRIKQKLKLANTVQLAREAAQWVLEQS